jgi:DeoR family transcriptional regulator of aga operon/DeoR family fructose operon transcriptional repressor
MQQELNDRQQQIMELLITEGELRISDLRDRFDVTEMTLRRDLEKMEKLGLLKRTFGGAIPITQTLRERSVRMMAEKMLIGKHAAESAMPGESIFIDGGTTTLQVARYLSPDKGLTVVTNALNVAAVLLDKGIRTIVLGGNALEATSTLVGPLAAEMLSRMAFDRAFLGATGCSFPHGFSNSDPYEAELKRMAIERSAVSCVVIDHTKFGVRSLVSFASLSQVRRIYTDRLPERPGLRDAIAEAGVDVIECEGRPAVGTTVGTEPTDDDSGRSFAIRDRNGDAR